MHVQLAFDPPIQHQVNDPLDETGSNRWGHGVTGPEGGFQEMSYLKEEIPTSKTFKGKRETGILSRQAWR